MHKKEQSMGPKSFLADICFILWLLACNRSSELGKKFWSWICRCHCCCSFSWYIVLYVQFGLSCLILVVLCNVFEIWASERNPALAIFHKNWYEHKRISHLQNTTIMFGLTTIEELNILGYLFIQVYVYFTFRIERKFWVLR